MPFEVFLVNLVPATKSKEFLAKFTHHGHAMQFGFDQAKGYCNDYERPEVVKIPEGTLIDTPCDYAIFIKEVAQ